MAVKFPLTNKANKYARDVVKRKIPVCEEIRLTCKLHLSDLKKEKKQNSPYKFDKSKSESILRFAELMPHIKGKWAGSLIVLEPWQCFFLACVFGWVRKKDGLRRYREVYAEIPRKNGKSLIAAIIGLYMAFVEGEAGAEVYSGAATEEQAHEVFKPAWLMTQKTPGFRKKFGIQLSGTENYPGNIYSTVSGSKFKAVVGKPKDGASVHCGIVDEFHEHATDHTYDCFDTGMGSREQPLLLVITTAGVDTASPCYATRDVAQDVLRGKKKKDSLFVLIYTIDPKKKGKEFEHLPEPWTFFENWKMANPNFGVSIFSDFLEKQYSTAMQNARKQNILKCKHCNLWSNAAEAFFNMVEFAACGDATLNIDDFLGEPCWLGLDLAAKKDLVALMLLFKRGIDYFLFSRYYLPKMETIGEDKAHYAGWVHDEYIETHEGNRIDLNLIQSDILELAKDFDLSGEENGGGEVCNDPWNAQQLIANLENKKVSVTEIGQNVQTLSEPMKELDAIISTGNFYHDANPVTSWCFSNTMGKLDKKDNVFPFKSVASKKIDGTVATINAMARAMTVKIVSKSIYEEREMIIL